VNRAREGKGVAEGVVQSGGKGVGHTLSMRRRSDTGEFWTAPSTVDTGLSQRSHSKLTLV
jgi:hypothetical protein